MKRKQSERESAVLERFPDLKERPILRGLIDSFVMLIVIVVCAALSFLLLVNINSNRVVNVVVGESMCPNYKAGQLLFYRTKNIQRNDIVRAVIIKDNKKESIVKRVIALPGETVNIQENGDVYIDGNLYQEPYLSASAKALTYNKDTISNFELKENEYLLLGDNRGNSLDSRTSGPFSDAQIKYSLSTKISFLNILTVLVLLIACVALIKLFIELYSAAIEMMYVVVSKAKGWKYEKKPKEKKK